MSASLWKIIHQNLQNLRNNVYVLHLTKAKRLEVITYKDKRYVSFVQISQYQEKEYKYYINFNDDALATLLEKMAKINNKVFGEEECMECRGIKTPIYTEVDKQIKRSKQTNHIMQKCRTNLDSLVPIAAVMVTCRLKMAIVTHLTANIANRTTSAANVHL